eukprot:TRINITY_DN1663_c0_g1_i1.p1 TRINITY_DN1663_c0_g1~~TRINITY_DN1663_c0_g1_i1.p1  ORF type:complete len:476 (+),score=121.55 TRINITY_DN1663_c0_g1_i1:135-1562(+)
MYWTTYFCLFVLVAFSVNAQNPDINTGTSYYALRFPDSGQASVTLPDSLSQALPASFSFEAWIMYPGTVAKGTPTTADGIYKTIVSRYAVRPDGTYHNMYADFNFQVQKTGNINFFMGSGLSPNFYGVIITPAFLPAGRWTHLAFSVHTPTGSANPNYATVYVDGVAFNSTWKTGNRQTRTDVPIHLGAYLNQDGDVKWWRGYMDEIRFWSAYRSTDEVKASMNVAISSKTQNLLAYYKCDSGAELKDETGNYDGQFVTGAGSVTYQLSGVKLGFNVQVGKQGKLNIELPGVGNKPFSYVISSVPDPTIGRLSFNGTIIFSDNVPFTLPGKTVTFEAAAVDQGNTTFYYYGTNADGREAGSTPVYVSIGGAACNPDSCGVCGGDNSTCSCLEVPYKGYDVVELERILLLYEIEQTMDLLHQVQIQLQQAQDALGSSSGANLDTDITTVQNFNSDCLDAFETDIDSFVDQLSDIPA